MNESHDENEPGREPRHDDGREPPPTPGPPGLPSLPDRVTPETVDQALEVIGELARQVYAAVADDSVGWTREHLLRQALAAQAAMNSLGATRLDRIAGFALDADGDVDEFAPDDLAPCFGWGPRQAIGTVAEAVDATGHAPGLLALAGQGHLEPWRIAIVTREVADASWRTREKVERALLEGGIQDWTGGKIRRRTRALVRRLEPAAERRAARKRADEQIGVSCCPGVEPGTTDWHATLRTTDAQKAYAAVEELAREMHAATTTGKTLGQCRADAMCDLILANAHVTTHATVLLPVNTDQEAATGAGSSDDNARSSQASDDEATREPATPETLDDRVGRWVRGDDDAIGDVEVPGIGVIDRETILRLLRDLDTRITAAIIDHATGALLAVGSTAYRPPTGLRRQVELRDRHCRFPACEKPARWCDLDHVIRWPDGPTDTGNLQLLCRHHHRAKHETAWTVTMDPDATCHWTSPTGHTYTTHPGLSEVTTGISAA